MGKTFDIFDGEGVTEKIKTTGNTNGIAFTNALQTRDFEGLAFVNLVDFDMLYGHRRNIDGYAAALTEFDGWLAELLPQLGVQAQVVTARAEEYVRTCRESYDIVTSRAVARLNVLAELCLPYAKVGGVFLAMKGALADEEIDEARRGIAQLGGSIERVYEYPIQDAVHKAVVIRKQKPTPP